MTQVTLTFAARKAHQASLRPDVRKWVQENLDKANKIKWAIDKTPALAGELAAVYAIINQIDGDGTNDACSASQAALHALRDRLLPSMSGGIAKFASKI